MKKKAVVVLPTYNEKGNIGSLIDEIFKITSSSSIWQVEVLVIDSHSPDGTAAVVLAAKKKYPGKLHLLKTEKEGLGKAYYRGFKYGLENLHPYLLFSMDADWSHLPQYIPQFLKKIEAGADFVIGSRYMKGGSIPENWGINRKIFSILGNQIIRWGFMKLKITDWTGGFRAFKAYIAKDNLEYIKDKTGYIFQVAFLDRALKNGARIKSVPIHFKNRRSGVSKIDPVKYSLQVFSYVFTHSSFIKFVIVGVIGFAIDFTIASSLINLVRFPKANANAISAEIAIISNFLLNNFWSFSHKKIQGGMFASIKKLVHFNLISSGSILIQWLGLKISLKLFGDKLFPIATTMIPSWIVYKILIITFIIIPYSYLLYNKIIWKEKK